MTNGNSKKSTEYVTRLTSPYGPLVPTDVLVVELNKIYHKFEALSYDASHDEIHVRLPSIWREMLLQLQPLLGSRPLRILDFGCGTGFEAIQAVRSLPSGSIDELVCYDLSSDMLNRCRERFANENTNIKFTNDLSDATNLGQKYDILLTNSLLHHLPDPLSVIDGILPFLTTDAVWLAGHEPSSRFYKNRECCELLKHYTKRQSIRKHLSPRKYFEYALRRLGLTTDPLTLTAHTAVKSRLFERRPSAMVVSRLVDFHVAHNTEEIEAGRGFDFQALAEQVKDSWSLLWTSSYNFMGPVYEGELTDRWRKQCSTLRSKFPLDGANVCCVWRRAAVGEYLTLDSSRTAA